MDYARLVLVVKRLIASTGRPCKFEILTAEPADPTQPWNGPAEPTAARVVTTPATFVPPSGTDFGLAFIAEDLLKRVDQVCLVAPVPAAFPLEKATSVIDASARWRVEWVQVLKPGSTVLLYAVGVKR